MQREWGEKCGAQALSGERERARDLGRDHVQRVEGELLLVALGVLEGGSLAAHVDLDQLRVARKLHVALGCELLQRHVVPERARK
eukprot:2732022-Rhodomonas_salina.2